MKKLICVLLCLCFLLSIAACFGKIADERDFTALSEKAQTVADTLVRDYGSTSVQYAIIDGGEIILSGSSGIYDKEGNRAVTKDDMYGVGSTSKMYVTAAAMMLVDQGLLDIDKPITDYIPEFKMADERYKEITSRMLMNHSSGIFGTTVMDTCLFDDPDKTAHDAFLDRLALQNLKAAPGEMSEYCNDGFSLLEIVVEHVSGVDFTEFLAKNISEPLGLKNTKTPQDDFDRSRLVKAYMSPFNCALPVDTVNAIGAGGIYSTAEELCLFSEVLTGNRPEILSAKSAWLMQREEYKNGVWPEDHDENIDGYGLGWDTVHAYPFGEYGINVIMKTGDTELYHSVITAIPEHDIAMAVVASGGNSNNNYTFTASILQELLLQKGLIKEIITEKTSVLPVQVEMPEELTAFSGLYANAGGQSYITVNDGVLTVSSEAGETKCIYIGDHVFSSEDGSRMVKFVQPGDGRTCLQITKIVTLPNVGQYVKCYFDCRRIEPVHVPETVLDAWSKRAGKDYYLVSERSTFQYYFVMNGMSMLSDFSGGYACNGAVIVDEDHAANTLNFREVSDYAFFMKDNIEYMKANGLVYICEDYIPEMNTDTVSCTIDEDGYARYFFVDTSVAGKTMTVSIPEGSAYAVYDEGGMCVNFTTITHDSVTILPTDGTVAFFGKAGDTFGIELK